MRKFLFLFFLISSCGLAKKSNSSVTFKPLPTPKIIENIENNKLNFTYLLLRSQTTIIDNNRKNQFNISLRIKKNDKILISGSLLVPLFKGMFTKNEMLFYEKLNKSFYKGDYKYISEILNYNLSLQSIENLILGQPIMFNKRKVSKLSSNSQYIFKSYDRKNKITKTYYFNPDKFTLKKQSFESKKGETLTVNYENYKKFESNNIPQFVTITAKNNDKSIKFEMKTKVSRINERISFPFKIPSGYNKVNL